MFLPLISSIGPTAQEAANKSVEDFSLTGAAITAVEQGTPFFVFLFLLTAIAAAVLFMLFIRNKQ